MMSLGRDAVALKTGGIGENDACACYGFIRIRSRGSFLVRRQAARCVARDPQGAAGRCPACGKGKIFRAYLKVNDKCPTCGEELHHQRADDAPLYMTIVVVGHIVVGLLLVTEEYWPDAPLWLHAALRPTLALVLSLWLLPIMKGGLIAHQRALRMLGFENAERPASAIGKSDSK